MTVEKCYGCTDPTAHEGADKLTVTNPTTSAQTLRQLAEKRLETINGLIEDLDAELADIKNAFEDLEYAEQDGLEEAVHVAQIIPEIEQIAGASEEILRMARLLEFEAAAAEQLRSCTDPRECLDLNRYLDDWLELGGTLKAVRKPFNLLSPALWRHAKGCSRISRLFQEVVND